MKNFVFGFLAVAVAIVVGSVAYLRCGFAQVPADVNAPTWERRLTSFAVHASVRRSAPRTPSPLAPSDEDLIAGGKLYMNGCAGCHGKLGDKDDGTPFFVPPPVFSQAGSTYSEPEMFWVIKHGIRRTGMSAYGRFYSEKEIWSLAAFVKRMKNLPPAVVTGIQAKKP
jgi:thiosulfate dehydrogenase